MRALLLLTATFAMAAQAQTPPLVPLLWTQGQPPETIRQAVKEIAEGGNTGFVWESRPHPDYLGPKWWSDLRVAVDEARRLGLEVWIFDEWMYPSGVAGGKLVAANPKFALHTIEERTLTVAGPKAEAPYAIAVAPGEEIVSVAAFRDRSEPVALPSTASVRWAAPAGNWRIVWAIARSHPPKAGWSMSNMIDVMNPEATAEFIRITHEATYQHFRDDFGKTIKGFFSDETGFRNIESYESLPGKPGMRMPWSPVFRAYFRKLKGYDIAPLAAGLWYDLGPRSRMVRYDFMDVCSRAFTEHFFKPQQEWCRKHGVRLIGHVVEDNHADHNLGYGPGHWFRAVRYLDMPGIDIVGYQVTPGVDAGGVPWQPTSKLNWDQEFFQFALPAMARGAALIAGTREILSEAFGAYGWSEGMRMLKWIGDWHIANGISVISPHAYTMKYNDPDCPPHFNRMSGNPQARYYADWTRDFQPLQKLVAGSDAVYDAAVVYTAESKWVDSAQTAAPAVRTLETHQISTVVLPYESLSEFGGRFRTVVLPYVRYVPGDAIEALARLAESGTRVVVLEAWPSGSVDARADDRVKAAVARLKRSAVLTTVWELPSAVERRVRVEPAPASLVVSQRRDAGGEWLILHNRSLESAAKGTVFVERAQAHAALYEAGVYWDVAHRVEGGRLAIDVDMPPYALWTIRMSAALPAVRKRPVYTARQPFRGAWKPGLGDWRLMPGKADFAGTISYSSTLRVDGDGAIGLDAGRVEEVAELFVNGKSLGVRLCPPYVWDLSGAVRSGDNDIRIDVTNTGLARWRDSFSHGDAVSGLLGPVSVLDNRASK